LNASLVHLLSVMMKINMFSKILRCYITLQRSILTRQIQFKDIGCKGDISLIIDVNTTDKIIESFNHDGIMLIGYRCSFAFWLNLIDYQSYFAMWLNLIGYRCSFAFSLNLMGYRCTFALLMVSLTTYARVSLIFKWVGCLTMYQGNDKHNTIVIEWFNGNQSNLIKRRKNIGNQSSLIKRRNMTGNQSNLIKRRKNIGNQSNLIKRRKNIGNQSNLFKRRKNIGNQSSLIKRRKNIGNQSNLIKRRKFWSDNQIPLW
jgi:hypothetical protein